MTSASQLFELLASDHRRQVLFLLCGTESLDVSEGLSTRGAARAEAPGDGDPPPAGRDSASAEQAARQLDAELRHLHLPKLEAEGVVEWDREAGTVSRGPAFEEVEPALRLFAANSVLFPGDLF